MVTVGFILVVLVQRVCGWAGFGISLLWLRRLLVLLFLACRRVDSTSAGSNVSGRSSGRLGLLADALPRDRSHRSQTRVNKL